LSDLYRFPSSAFPKPTLLAYNTKTLIEETSNHRRVDSETLVSSVCSSHNARRFIQAASFSYLFTQFTNFNYQDVYLACLLLNLSKIKTKLSHYSRRQFGKILLSISLKTFIFKP
jgi:hypothetical protein